MPIGFEFDARKGLSRSRVTGAVTAEDVAVHCRRLRDAGAHRRPGLVDVRGVDGHVTMADLLGIARVAAAELSETGMARRAVLVGGGRHFEWARVMATLVAGWLNVGVFTDLHEAELWLLHQSAPASAVANRVAAHG